MIFLPGTSFGLALLVGLGLGALCGCTPSSGIDTQPDSALPDTCHATSFADLVGQPVSRIDSSTLPRNRRIVFASSPGFTLTDADRLTILVSSAGRITQMRCG